MAYDSLHMTIGTIQEALGLFLGWGIAPNNWGAREQTQAAAIIRDGVAQFYNPPILPGEVTQHEWTFLSPWAPISVKAGQAEYDLPEDFAGLTDELTYRTDSTGFLPVRIVSDVEVRRCRQGASGLNGYPEIAAVVPLASDGTQPQAWSLVVYPTPDVNYELQIRYHSNPSNITSRSSFPLGGQQAAAALQASVLASAELMINDERGLRWSDFIEKLRSAVAFDRHRNVQSLGYCGDGPRLDRYEQDIRLTFNGVEI